MYGYYEYVELTPQQVLQKVSQQQIFEWILGEKIEEGRRYRSPIRKDRQPGCRIDTLANGDMLFVDFGDTPTHRSCFKLAMDTHGASLQSVLTMICDAFGLSKNGNDYSPIPISFEFTGEPVKRTEIYYQTRKFGVKDKRFWNLCSITEEQLKEDRVAPASRVIIHNYKTSKVSSFRPQTICYAIDFGNAVKLYQPYNAQYKFITNCTVDHVGNINNISSGDRLIIAKAYKDHRILRNLERPNTIWLPSENIIPSKAILVDLCVRFKEIVIFFDNDEMGIKLAVKLMKVLDDIEWGKARIVNIPIKYRLKDLGDFLPKEGRQDTLKLLNQLEI
jgi:hypothetical protein